MPANSRRLARQCAVQALYQWRITAQPDAQIRASFIQSEALGGESLAYFSRIIDELPPRVAEIDAALVAHLDRAIERVDITEQAILRLGAFELLYRDDVPTKVIINEAVELAKLFCAEHGYKYVNGVLDKVAAQARPDSPDSK